MYTPLLPGQIRLFRLEPRDISSTQDPNQSLVRGVLEHHRLADHPRYNALSYCWGSNANLRPISVNGEAIAVHSNLEAALRELQSYRGDMLLWADRLCINQKDDDEKTGQVQQMRHIYTEASLVFAWLGEAADDSDLIMDHFQTIGEDIFPGNRGMLETEGQLDQIVVAHNTPKSRRALSNAYRHFCQRSYWQRLWVMQEFVLAQEVVVACGDRRVTFQQLLTSIRFIQRPRSYFQTTNALTNIFNPDAITEIIEAVVQTYRAAIPSFMQGIVMTRNRHGNMNTRSENHLFRVLVTSLVLEVDYNHPKSSDPRDRVFAILSFTNDAEEFPMFPDYQRGWQCIYTKLAIALLRQGHIDILSFCQFTEVNPLLLDNEKLPSWVPDWNLKIKYPCVSAPWNSYFSASLNSSDLQKVQVDENRNQVSLLGVTVDTISFIGSLWDPDWLAPFDMKAAQNYLSEVEQFCKRSSHSSVTSLDLNQVVGRMCIADRICCEGSRMRWRDKNIYKNGYCQCYIDTVSAFEKGSWPTEVTYCQRLRLLHSRRPFISRTGLVGLAPSNVEVGDELCIFLGGKTPYIVSKRIDGVSRLRGETYVHGIMYGEFWAQCANPDIKWIVLS
ncbi:heterokaryon incompatibility protein-domain-containing protein [Hyaloscypha finlandica]|nr:heterokaryon incompatibility protein-domain-containing protein [Hyaloscypha finlandica]